MHLTLKLWYNIVVVFLFFSLSCQRGITGSLCTVGQSTSAYAVWWSGSLTFLGALEVCSPSPFMVSSFSLHSSCSVSGMCSSVSSIHGFLLQFSVQTTSPHIVIITLRYAWGILVGFLCFNPFLNENLPFFIQQCLPWVSQSFSCLGCYLRSTLLWCVCWSRSTCTFLVELVRIKPHIHPSFKKKEEKKHAWPFYFEDWLQETVYTSI